MKKKNNTIIRPTITEIEKEMERLEYKKRHKRNIKYILGISAVVVALIIILTNIWFPVLRVVGTSMQPKLENDDIIVCLNSQKNIEKGDIIAFYNNGNILLKRVVAMAGDTVELNEKGELIVNSKKIEEPYVTSMSYEPCDIEFPITVKADTFFVLGDQRSTSMDSRTETVGLVSRDSIIGKVLIKIWPLENVNLVK